VAWDVEGTGEFADWYESLDADEQVAIDESIDMLIEYGPALGRPHVDTIRQSAYSNMKELRTQIAGRPFRTLFAFDPRAQQFCGDKTGDGAFTSGWFQSPIDSIRRILKN